MKHFIKAWLCALTCFVLFSCRKEQLKEQPQKEAITPEMITQIKAMGFSTHEIRKVKNGYVVEGDIFLPDHSFTGKADGRKVVIAKTEHYQTWNMVATSAHREITISLANLPNAYTVAADEAIARYNALGLRISFRRVASGGEINIFDEDLGDDFLGLAGFPDATGEPFNEIRLNAAYIGSNPHQGRLTTIIAHEIGHCIGFRHTDYFNTTFSCGFIGGGEDPNDGGADHIPGTPATADADSWMLACLPGNQNRPFTDNDQLALKYLYGPLNGSRMVADGVYKILSAAGGKALDVDANTINSDGAKVQQWDWLNGDNQKWIFHYLGNGYYRIINQASGKVLDIDNNFIGSNGARAQQWSWINVDNQQWQLRRMFANCYIIINKRSGKVLDVDNNFIHDNGAQVQQWASLNGTNQLWFLYNP